MTDVRETEIAATLERYRAARGIQRGSKQWAQLLQGYQRKPLEFAELLDAELARMGAEK